LHKIIVSLTIIRVALLANPFSPSTLLSTCCTIASVASNLDIQQTDIGITCATCSPLDGRRVAVGCEDASIRVWALDGSHQRRRKTRENTLQEARSSTAEAGDATTLLGHKGGWPIFGLDFCRDGRHLLSCGGDGTIRLWDTGSLGPIGNPYTKQQKRSGPSNRRGADFSEIQGAALCVYRGHAAGTPVWTCRFAPSGYYFASGGMDHSVRIWSTDRIAPLRVCIGHTESVGKVAWHPNCNYVFSGSDDRTVRMWDIQTGRCVRLLIGLKGDVTCLEVSPNGRHAVAGDVLGYIHVWDIGTSRLVKEIRSCLREDTVPVYTLAFSSCGQALASGGADNFVKLWDVSSPSENRGNPDFVKNDVCDLGPSGLTTKPVTQFQTKNTQLLNLFYSRRNLLMGVGKYTTQ